MVRIRTEYNKQHYEKIKENRKIQVSNRQKEIRNIIRKMKLEQGCDICGYNKVFNALHYHHISDDKETNIAKMVSQGRALTSILKEIDKCQLVCSNCHAELHTTDEGILL